MSRTDELKPRTTLFCRVKGLEATGYEVEGGFLVLRESRAVLSVRPAAERQAPNILRLRDELVTSGILVADSNSLLFTQDYVFESPSKAAAVIQGGSTNGLTAWIDASGKTLKEHRGGLPMPGNSRK